MSYENMEVLKNFYGMKVQEDPNRSAKVKAIIESMGDRWLFAKQVGKKSDGN